MTINKITQAEYPDIWDYIVGNDYVEMINKEHRRGSNFYTNFIYEIDAEFFPDYPQLHGFWMSDTVIWDLEYGFADKVDALQRVEKKKIVIEKEEWTLVK
jgi:hypothetical protein